ncbi:peptidoglycan-binding protein [Siccirubricoccus sp. KC 17139]|uniref:Peptidoglycan-binding protein n=1 Tax=Siccirubricoccus soli TaxID=2899147 RepID=A0ABT1D836_9PROT|nr:peptidoglycan-binding domain-containing protein [Siccirubricoccus soli]MCO6418088.1 peptidoglycan-binding protein [Siccirubricoccus soli]MCP2684223.1 peptidoglycan-binding protein [Siccirubricoccus soli]
MIRTTTMALAGLLLAGPALAQQAPSLMYSQPLAPAAVTAVQEKLRQAGSYTGRADGVWGPDSQAALERFQMSRGLQASGQLNQATAATLGLSPSDLLAAGPTAGPAPGTPAAQATEPLSQRAVRNVQRRLRVLGFYRGELDGAWGAGTQSAIERFQQGRGLQATGQLNPATISALGLDASNLEAPPR